MSLADDKKLDSYRFCELPAGMFVYTGPARDKVVFCCQQRGTSIELTPVEALIVAARLAFEGRKSFDPAQERPSIERNLSLVRNTG